MPKSLVSKLTVSFLLEHPRADHFPKTYGHKIICGQLEEVWSGWHMVKSEGGQFLKMLYVLEIQKQPKRLEHICTVCDICSTQRVSLYWPFVLYWRDHVDVTASIKQVNYGDSPNHSTKVTCSLLYDVIVLCMARVRRKVETMSLEEDIITHNKENQFHIAVIMY